MRPPATRYAKSGGINIAYQVTGSGPLDLVLVPGFVSHLDHDWQEPRSAHFLERLASFSRLINERVRAELDRFRGRQIDTAGDGFLATFDGPARAIRAARAIIGAVRPLGLEVRAGLHTGEIETVGSDVRGLAVHIGARVAAAARPGEVIVSSTVRDLVAGSGLEFRERGVHKLIGVPGEWRLFTVVGTN